MLMNMNRRYSLSQKGKEEDDGHDDEEIELLKNCFFFYFIENASLKEGSDLMSLQPVRKWLNS